MLGSQPLRRGLLALVGIIATAVTPAFDGRADPWSGVSDALFTNHTSAEAGAGTALAQDHSGFLWVGTQGGLARWDGYHFRRYTSAAETPGSLPDSFILTLYVDSHGTLWAGTSAGGLVRYDAAHDSFAAPVPPQALSDVGVSAIVEDGADGLWIGTGAGLDHLDAREVIKSASANSKHLRGLPTMGVQALWVDRSGAMWVGTRNGLWRRTFKAAEFSPVSLSTHEGSSPAVTRIYEDSAGRVWIGVRPGGAFVIDSKSTRPVHESGPVASYLHAHR
jgi:ligand-binding sensor domain-containing protein